MWKKNYLPPWKSVVLFFVIFAILAIRSWETIVWPILGHEDGKLMLGFFFNSSDPSSILHFNAGYISLTQNLLAWIAARGSVTLVPHLFCIFSLCIAAVGISLFSTSRYSWLVPDPDNRSTICLLLALLPLGKGYMTTNLTYSQWSLLFLLFVLLAGSLPRYRSQLILYSIVVFLCVCSHPLSLIAIPLCVVQFFIAKSREHKLSLTIYVCAILLYQLFGVEHKETLQIKFGSFIFAAKVFLSRVSFETIFGAHAATTLVAKGSGLYVYLLGMIVMAYYVFLIARQRSVGSATALVIMIILAYSILLISVCTRYVDARKVIFLENPHLQRYIYVPKLMFALLLLSQIVPRIKAFFLARHHRGKNLALCMCTAYLVAVNSDSHFLYRSSQVEAKRLALFLNTVSCNINQARSGLPYSSEHIFKRGKSWDIRLSIDRRLGRKGASNN